MTRRLDRRIFLQGGLAAPLLSSPGLVAWGAAGKPSPIDGTWKIEVGRLDNGDMLTVHYEIRQRGRKLTGRSIHMAAYGYGELRDGKIRGDRFSFRAGGFNIRGRIQDADTLAIEANFDSNWPYTNMLNPELEKVPFGWEGNMRPFLARRVAHGAGDYPAPLPLPALADIPDNGLARTPPMIWGAWYTFTTTITDALIRDMARTMVSTGMRDAGYDILNMEVGWTGQRDADGNLRANAKFPDMKGLCDYVHSLGLKVGICTSPGPWDCIGYPASFGHEERDARTFASWGIDFIKHDACSGREIYPDADGSRRMFQKMGAALQDCGRPIAYAICQYGFANVWEWGARAGGNSWRTTDDIEDTWESVSAAFNQSRLAPFARPGHWNDPDYLMVGLGGLSTEEYRLQMSLWCMLAAPLITSADLRSMSADTRAILMNRELIAIDQDVKGVQGQCVNRSGVTETWLKPLGDGHAIALFNKGATAKKMALDASQLGLGQVQEARDVWAARNVTLVKGRYEVDVPSHGAVVLRVPDRA
jgi:alpha-galactosidase